MASSSLLGPDNLDHVPMEAVGDEVQELSDGEIEELQAPPGKESLLPRMENKKKSAGDKKKARDPQAKIGQF